jgi:hypothetical protein
MQMSGGINEICIVLSQKVPNERKVREDVTGNVEENECVCSCMRPKGQKQRCNKKKKKEMGYGPP